MNIGGRIAIIVFGVLPTAFLLYAIGVPSDKVFFFVVAASFLIIFFMREDEDEKESVVAQKPEVRSESKNDSGYNTIERLSDADKKKVISLQQRLTELVDIAQQTHTEMLELPTDDIETYNLFSRGLDTINIEISEIRNELREYIRI
jgi:hypothetical protein